MSYDPRSASFLSWAAARRAFAAGADTPRAWLERCLERIAAVEPQVQAFSHLDVAGARRAADAADQRWRAGRPRSVVDGMPVGIKDCFDVAGMPTEVNSGIFRGQVARIDGAHAHALRHGGAAIVGKTVTTELTMAGPGPTWNPWDLTRTPGGSSSGSAAAVAARMLPLGSGSQVRGSVIRPAALCGVIGWKPTWGALNLGGGFDPSPSLNHLGLLAGTLTDVWDTAHHLVSVVSGAPGCEPFAGPKALPAGRKPVRLARQYTPGWQHTDEESKGLFAAWLQRLAAMGVEVVEPDTHPDLAEYEAATAATPEWFFDILVWEMLWPLKPYAVAMPEGLSDTVHGYIARAEKLTVEDFRRAHARRLDLRRRHRALHGRVDGFITLSVIGPAQVGQPKTGSPWYNDPSSAIGAPSLNLPLLAAQGVPLGVQLMGFEHEDADLFAMGRWLLSAFGSPTV